MACVSFRFVPRANPVKPSCGLTHSRTDSEDAGFITFLGKFGIALMYAGLALVVLGLARLLWSKRSFLRTSPRILGPISLPHGTPNSVDNEALPYIRPDTPGGSRPSTPFDGSPNSSVNGRSQTNRPGLLYYLPVWVMPPGDRSPGGATSPNAPDANWSQYFSNLSFVDSRDQANRYHPIPSFSRPPSPSNNSILHAPGSTHDGAFDGVQLHSIQAPQPTRSSSTSVPTPSSSSPLPPSTTGPNSPPAYSTLRSVGAHLFRPFHAVSAKEPRAGFDPEHPSPEFVVVDDRFGGAPQEERGRRQAVHESKLFSGGSTAPTSPHRQQSLARTFGSRSPSPHCALPPQYTSPRLDGSVIEQQGRSLYFDDDGRGPGPAASSQGAPAARSAAPTEHGTELGRGAQVWTRRQTSPRDDESRRDGDDDDVDEREFEFDFESEDRSGIPLEEEVDRLLNEMSPDSTRDLEKGQPLD